MANFGAVNTFAHRERSGVKGKPQLNMWDRPYYLVKDTYAKDFRDRKKPGNRKPPWKRTTSATERRLTGRAVTRYDIEGKTAYNLSTLLEAGKPMTISVCPGYNDITNWRKLRFDYGRSYVKVMRPDGTRRATTLEQWRPREEKNDADFKVYIKPVKSTVIDKEQIIEDITQQQERMKEYDDEHIEFLWKVRNTLAKEYSAYKWRAMDCHPQSTLSS